MRILNNLLITIVIFIFFSLFACSQKRDIGKKMITKRDTLVLKKLKEVLWPKAYRSQDTILLDRILDDSFKMIDRNGKTYTKKDEINWIKEHATTHDSFRYELKRLDIYKNGTAVIAGTGHIYKDSVYSIYQSSNVLIKKDSLWKAILSHVSGFENVNKLK